MTLRELIDAKCGSQRGLANELGVHESTISLWLSGYRFVSWRYAQEMARILGVDMEELAELFRNEGGNGNNVTE